MKHQMPHKEEYLGAAAQVLSIPLPPPPYKLPEHEATVAQWLVLAPNQHPHWPHYLLTTCHLRDVEGQSRPPQRKTPENTHNMMLMALNPAYAPWSRERFVEIAHGGARIESKEMPGHLESPILTPLNISLFVDGLMDAQAVVLTELVAIGLSTGTLVCEPDDFRGGHSIWEFIVKETAKSIRVGDERLVVPLPGKRLH